MKGACLGILLLTVAALPGLVGVPQERGKMEAGCRIDGIEEMRGDPCRARLRVKYFIDPSTRQPCRIGAYVPSREAMADFAMAPAGENGGVPKGERSPASGQVVDLHYLGETPRRWTTVEVVIFDASGPLCSRVFPWKREWARFAVQDIQPVDVTPNRVRFVVRYFIDPAYPDPCYISGFVPQFENCSNDFNNMPAGFNPAGVAKGQKTFADNISFELIYHGGRPYRSSSLDVVVYRPGRNLLATPFRWGQVWRAAAERSR
jgi:hypothetical protein